MERRPKPRVSVADPGKDVDVGLTQYYTATTLDGFIAGADQSLDWLFTRDQDRVELRLEELGRNRDFACARYAVVPDPA